MSHGAYMNKRYSRRDQPWLGRCSTLRSVHIWISHVAQMNESWRIYLIRGTLGGTSPGFGGCSTLYVAHIWMIYLMLCCTGRWVMSHANEWVMVHIGMSHDTYMNALINIMSHLSMSHVARMNESCHTYERVMSHMSMSHVARKRMSHGAHMNESWHVYAWVTEMAEVL